MTPVARNILIACIAGFVVQWYTQGAIDATFALWPPANPIYGTNFQPWQLITYAFLHGGLAHLFFNMFALYMFGPEIERLTGSRRFLIYYLVCVLSAALTQLVVQELTGDMPAKIVGASGGVFGLLLAYGLAFPRRKLMLLFPPIPMPAWLFVTLYGLLELYLGFSGRNTGVAHFAHLGGMAGGIVMILYWRSRRGFRR